MELALPRSAAADVAVAAVVDLTESRRRGRPLRREGPARRSRAAPRPMLPIAAWAPRAGARPSVGGGPAKRSALFAWVGHRAWAALALSSVIALAIAGSGDVRTDGAARGVHSRDSAGAGDPLPASEGLGGRRLPMDPQEPGSRSGETAYF